MAAHWAFPLISAFLLTACQYHEEGQVKGPEATPLEGELRILPADTSFMRCGSLHPVAATGPGMAELAARYNALQPATGQWIKTWCTGSMAPLPNGDSILVVEAYAHMDPEVQCPLVPVDSLAGEYLVEGPVPGGVHRERVLFFPDGRARIISTAPGLYDEVDGQWGLDSDHDPVFNQEDGQFTLQYYFEGGVLVRLLARSGAGLAYERRGDADPMAGAYGRTARWLSTLTGATGSRIAPEALRPSTPLDSILPDPRSQDLFWQQAADSLGSTGIQRQDLTTVGDVFKRMRTRLRTMPR